MINYLNPLVMKNSFFLSFIFIFHFTIISGQSPEQPVLQFIHSINQQDSLAFSTVTSSDLMLKSVNEQGRLAHTPLSIFYTSVFQNQRKNKWLEKIGPLEIDADDRLAHVRCNYSFFLDEKLSHCGQNHFSLYKNEKDEWIIFQITDSRFKNLCSSETTFIQDSIAIETLMNLWHQSASKSNASIFFDSLMWPEAIYLGTDISEKWKRDELKYWSASAFEKDTAWDFKVNRRSIYKNEFDNNIIWLEEDLLTWMGPCRGSAVLIKKNQQWKIMHYNLAVAVSNDSIYKYMKIIGLKKPKK